MIIDIYIASENGRTSEINPSHTKVICVPKLMRIELKFKCQSMSVFQKSGRWRKDASPHPRPGAQPREGGEARPKVELVVGDFNDPASLKPAFASVDEAFVVVNGKNLNRLEANALDRSRAFKRLRL